MSVANEIKAIRQKAFLSQGEFAESLPVSFATVNRWETGKTTPKMTAMRKIRSFCDANGISINELQNALLEAENLKPADKQSK